MPTPLATRPVQILQKTYQLPLLQGGTLQDLQDRIKTRQGQIRQGTVTRSRLKGRLKQTQELSAQQRLDLLNAQIKDYRALIQLVTSHKEAYQRFLLQLAAEVRQVFAQKCQQIQRDEQERAKDEAYARQRNNPALVANLRQEKRELLEELVLLDKAASLMLKKIDLIRQELDRIAADKGLQENLVLGLANDLEVYKRSISRRQRAQQQREDTKQFADMTLNFEEYMSQYLGPFQQLIDQTAVTDRGMGRTVSEISQLAEEVLGATANLASLDELLKFEVVSAEIQDHLGLALERAAMERNWAGGGLGLISDQELDATSVEAAIGQIQGYLQTELDRLQASYLAEELERQQQAALEAERQAALEAERQAALEAERQAALEAERKAEEERRRQEAERWNMDAVPLKSERGVDYTRLRDLLKSGQWKEADLETGKLMERALGTSDWSKIYQEEKLLLKFPCADLKTIDQLWVRASQGRYGFSVQKEIYVKCGAKPDGNYPGRRELSRSIWCGAKPDGNYPGDTIWYKFCNEVGWRVKNSWVSWLDLDWGGTGVPGHLPSFSVFGFGGLRTRLFVRIGDDDMFWHACVARGLPSLASRLVKCNL